MFDESEIDMQDAHDTHFISRYSYFSHGVWLITFLNDHMIMCYHGKIIGHDSSHFQNILKKRGIRVFQIIGDKDIASYEFQHDDLTALRDLIPNLKRIL